MILYFVTLLLRRSYSFLSLTFFSLIVGGFLFGVVFSFTKSATTYLVQEGKVLAGGDIILSSPYPITTDTDVMKALVTNGHTLSTGRNLQAVFANTTSSSTAPATLRLVSEKFPLYGAVTLQDGDIFKPEKGIIYGELAFLERIGAKKGDTVSLGGKDFMIGGVLEKEPDAVSLGISFTPKVLMFEGDFDMLSSEFSQSRTTYKIYIKQNSTTPLTTLEIKNLEKYAKENKIRFDNATDGPNNLIRGLSSVKDFIGIVLSITLFLVVINIGANLVYVLTRFRKTIALLKIHGATTGQIQSIYTTVLALVGFVAGLIGAVLGVVTSSLGLTFLAEKVGIVLVPTSVWYVALLGGLFGGVFVVVSAFPFLAALQKIKPKELLMNSSSSSSAFTLKDGVFYIPIPILLIGILYIVTSDLMLALISVLVCATLFAFFMGLSYGLIRLMYRVRASVSFIFQSILSYIYIRIIRTSITTASIMTAFCGVFIVIAVQQNITTNLQANVSKTAPSLYLVDITKSQREGVKRIVGETYQEYPIVRGRLLKVNDRLITEADAPDLRREFNMTYRDTLIDGERVLAGTFGNINSSVKVPVSIDKGFADDLGGVAIGDTLHVFIQGITLVSTVTSIREVDSTSGVPFFYLVFPTSVLSSFPASYFATADVDESTRITIERAIGGDFSNIIPIATGVIIATISTLLDTVVSIVTVVGIPSSILGVLLILVMLWQSLYERSSDVLVMRAFGFSRQKVTALFIIETGFLSILSGIIAYLVAHVVAYALNEFLFSFTAFSFAVLPLYIIVGNVIIVSIFSYILSYRLAKTSLKKLLAEK